MANQPLIRASGVVKGYPTAAGYLPVLSGVDFAVNAGELVAITGASGVGKSTLLHVLGTLDRPESGSVEIAGLNVFSLGETRMRTFRNRTIGFVFQFHHLMPEFTALENVMMPGLVARLPEREVRTRATGLLADLGLQDRKDHRPGALSGGEQQRVAVARALVQSPQALLADEPTGNLDRETGERLHQVLRRVSRERGLTVVVVTHNQLLAAACDRRFRLQGGRLLESNPEESGL